MRAGDAHDVSRPGAHRLLEGVCRLPVEAPARDLEQQPGAGRPGVQLHPDRAAEQVHVACDRLDPDRGGHGPVARGRRLRDGPGGVLATEEQQTGRDERRVVPEAPRLVEHRRGSIAERRLLARATRELDRGGEEQGVDRLEGARSGHRREHRPRAVGPGPVEEVVVDLHHDPAARGQRDSGARPQPVAAPARRPGGDPARIVEHTPRIRGSLRDAGPSEARPAASGRPTVERRRLRGDVGADAVEDHVVDQ